MRKNILVPNSGDMNKNDTSAKHAFTYIEFIHVESNL